jgi:serine protease AprX
MLKQAYNDLGFHKDEIKKDNDLYHRLEARIHAHKIVDAQHQYVDGTSVAAPIVTSVIAQMLEANPRLTPQQIRAILTRTARQIKGAPVEQQGAGILNASAAVKATLETI